VKAKPGAEGSGGFPGAQPENLVLHLGGQLPLLEDSEIAPVLGRRILRLPLGQLDEILGDDGVLVVPTTNAAAWPAEGPMPTDIGGADISPTDSVNTQALNMTGHPAVSVPIGFDDAGVPIGLQIVAPRFRDDLALGLAAELEQALGWAQVASGYEPFPTFA